ncbi:MarR family winged helix-turn-helix transcriptional regulator [Chloroflexota bacterium]
MSEQFTNIDNLSDTDLWCLLVRTWYAISRLRELELAQFGLTVEQSSILKIMSMRGGSTTAKELEYLTMRQQHSISTLINRMQKSGLVDKTKKPNERRYRISITPEGEKLTNQVTITSVEIAFSSLSEAERDIYSQNIRAIYTKSRELLGLSYNPPYLQPIDNPIGARRDNKAANSIRTYYELWTSLDIAGFAMLRLRKLELAKLNLTSEQSMVLSVIQHCGGSTTAKDIELFTTRQHHSISTLINRMVKNGLVTRTKSPHEKMYRISMTPEGENTFNRITTDSIDTVFEFLTNQKRREFAGVLMTLYTETSRLLSMHQRQPLALPVG